MTKKPANMLVYSFEDTEYNTDANTLPAEGLAYLLQYGWQQTLNDQRTTAMNKIRTELKLAKGDPDTPEVIAAGKMAVQKRMDKILAGLMFAGTGKDPLRAAAKRIVETQANANNWKLSTAQKEKFIDEMLTDKIDLVKAEVQRQRQVKAAAKPVEVSLDQLIGSGA
jgi:hypothetical protein